ncbi:RnfH family protein [Mycoavidus sp. B2-EB]|uniref:RnfH family protein n=1 Tax=Mycoavidus sp. B2-EB TaxID=2651972 RepID=UPI0016278811|nr:RnfH family protein [Mycoavidus sp. B2-EB]BBO59579.1 UPF0125 protein [Mycoavidus sp. B2-EB]
MVSQLEIEICYALPECQTVLKVILPVGATVRQAIAASGIAQVHPELDLTQQAVGIWGKIESLETVLAAHDRVEIYRPLKVDPKLARQRRAEKARRGHPEGRRWRA